MTIKIKRDEAHAESNITIIGIIRNLYDRPQYVLVDSDEGRTSKLKFPGLRFRVPSSSSVSLEDVAKNRFEEQTGMEINMLGLRTIIPTRSRHGDRWIFRNVFLGAIDNFDFRGNDGRQVYVADVNSGFPKIGEYNGEHFAISIHDSRKRVPIDWVVDDNCIVAKQATDFFCYFNWPDFSTNWYHEMPTVTAEPQFADYNPKLGCALAIASMIIAYQPNPKTPQQVILIKRKGDKHPGFPGGKIESLTSSKSKNIDPVSCCAIEGSEELGFEIIPDALIGVAITPLEYPIGSEKQYYHSIINYCFLAHPRNHLEVQEALENPGNFLEEKMEDYVVEDWDVFSNRFRKKELRMPDMSPLGDLFYHSPPGHKITLNQIRNSGSC